MRTYNSLIKELVDLGFQDNMTSPSSPKSFLKYIVPHRLRTGNYSATDIGKENEPKTKTILGFLLLPEVVTSTWDQNRRTCWKFQFVIEDNVLYVNPSSNEITLKFSTTNNITWHSSPVSEMVPDDMSISDAIVLYK